jgi:hypothetical protein
VVEYIFEAVLLAKDMKQSHLHHEMPPGPNFGSEKTTERRGRSDLSPRSSGISTISPGRVDTGAFKGEW